ncbi:hypothetical protein L861_09335 [Litchfieldella anticariensis FP35 = DSM 16096]|uniref:Uncharacterized protein n=1 Tax=Litchfieldella anticariensis (strain DSM 16096 / CECT 5854 / CIP 108499 / LMG 22089 / FP35) TaxID=1121939 RepID=S2LCP8_LITA3|nr:hypothetical protein [Halomonas anticariensis]EPC02536.1 hypothetical protein L861_09335 [Halomonas anticariensis FP35 = DSM 16096]
MIVTLIWLIAFAVILYMTLKGWNGPLGSFFERHLPGPLKSKSDERWIWCPALAVLGATAIVHPVDMLLTLIVLAVIGWVIKKVFDLFLKKGKHS